MGDKGAIKMINQQRLVLNQNNRNSSSSKNQIIKIDAIELLNSLPTKSIKLIVTDPPYGIAYHSGHYKHKNPHDPVTHDWNFQIGPFFEAINQVLAEDGAVYLFTRWDVYPLWANYIPYPLKLKNCIVWMKDNWSAGDLEGNFGNQYELIMFLTKDHKIRGKRWPNIWKFPRVPAGKLRIATEKPVELLQRAIMASSDEGDLILDPFCGSGSTGEAAMKCGRHFLLGDIDAKMVRISSYRLGVKVKDMVDDLPVVMPACPILKIIPPDPHLWGIHPEDLAEIIKIEESRAVTINTDYREEAKG